MQWRVRQLPFPNGHQGDRRHRVRAHHRQDYQAHRALELPAVAVADRGDLPRVELEAHEGATVDRS